MNKDKYLIVIYNYMFVHNSSIGVLEIILRGTQNVYAKDPMQQVSSLQSQHFPLTAVT